MLSTIFSKEPDWSEVMKTAKNIPKKMLALVINVRRLFLQRFRQAILKYDDMQDYFICFIF